MLTIEFHSHTIYSKDSLAVPDQILAACTRKGIDRIVITDHNTTRGALAAQALDPQRVIIGEEIMTSQGELLAAFVQEEIPPDLSPMQTIKRLKEQGAFISVSHPFDQYRSGHWQVAELEKIVPFVDAIETFNARCMFAKANRQAQAFAQLHQLAGTAGSDAHAIFEIGRAVMLLPEFSTADDLRQVIRQAQFRARLSSPLVHFYSRYAVWYKRIFPKLLTNY
jgi:predicted metal-dependent phosphoesterase TrpH